MYEATRSVSGVCEDPKTEGEPHDGKRGAPLNQIRGAHMIGCSFIEVGRRIRTMYAFTRRGGYEHILSSIRDSMNSWRPQNCPAPRLHRSLDVSVAAVGHSSKDVFMSHASVLF